VNDQDSIHRELGSAPAFFFAGPSKTLLAGDEGEPITGVLRERERVIAAADRLLKSQSAFGARFIVGAVPFVDDAPVRLFCPARTLQFGRWCVEEEQPRSSERVVGPPATVERSLSDSEAHFTATVADATRAIREGQLKKVVLARVKDATLGGEADLGRLLRLLRARNPHGFTYALALDNGTPAVPSTLVGASPELLVSRRGSRVVSAPLAGSIPRSSRSGEDRERAANLLRSSKDRHEHRLVVSQILDSLRPYTRELSFEREPILTATHSMWHLSTRIEGVLRDRGVSSLELALSLHPTPAVCGTPTTAARSFIARSERFERGYFTGTLGHMDAEGNGDWIVTIRCAEISGLRARVFAGAGVVEGSVPLLELAETEAKMQTMLDALGLTGLS
jgi:isochorismate synthase